MDDLLAQQICMPYVRLEREGFCQSIRYWMYGQSRAKIACQNLPPWEDVLRFHTFRPNYQAFLWRQSLLAQQAKNSPL